VISSILGLQSNKSFPGRYMQKSNEFEDLEDAGKRAFKATLAIHARRSSSISHHYVAPGFIQ
jgi:hypothetical protein